MISDTEKHYLYTGSSDISGRQTVSSSSDILLGTATVPLLSLVTRKTGISGWFPVNLPSIGWGTSASDQSEECHHGNRGLERVVGGLELQIKFAHHEDLERVTHAARGVGWSPDFDVENRDWESAGRKGIAPLDLIYWCRIVTKIYFCAKVYICVNTRQNLNSYVNTRVID